MTITKKQRVVLVELARRNEPATVRQIADRLEKARPGSHRFTDPAVRGQLAALEGKALARRIEPGLWVTTLAGQTVAQEG